MAETEKRLSPGKIAAIVIVIAILLGIVGFTVYVNDYYHAEASTLEQVTVQTAEQNGYLVIGDPDNALIGYVFYPGGKVEAEAYVPYLAEVVEKDPSIVCFVVQPLFHLAILSPNAADGPIQDHSLGTWVTGGHSLGGVVASSYAHSNQNTIDGLILLAAYPTEYLKDDSFSVLEITASNDEVLNWDSFDDAQENLPPTTNKQVIEGGTHGQFGSYGEQKGDGQADVSEAEQREQVADLTVEFIDSLKEAA